MRKVPLIALVLALGLAGCGKVKPVQDGDTDADAPDGGDVVSDLVDVEEEDADSEPTDCTTDGDCDDSDPCTDDTCSDEGICEYSFNTDSCSDGYDCTSGESCDGAGGCAGGTPDDDLCAGAEVCLPECFPATGCGAPPSTLVVDCPDEVTLPAAASCTITLDGLAAQEACLECTAEVEPVTLSSDDFGDSTGTCGLPGGWSLVTGMNCFDRVDDGADCTPGGAARTCCADPSTIVSTVAGDCRLRTDRGQNCTGDDREWQMERTFDTRGLTDIEVCFNTSHDGATGNEGILLYAEDSTHSEQVFCQMGPPVLATGINNEWPSCVTLPAWAEGNAALTLRFIMHSNDGGDRLYLDDVTVHGLPSACAPTRAVAFAEDFDPCTATIADGWNGWSVTGIPSCSDVCTGAGGAVASEETWLMTHAVDASGLGSDVRLCFDLGDSGFGSGMYMRVSMDTGSGFQDIWYWSDNMVYGSCSRVCLRLSDIDPAAARNPGLSIRFELHSGDSDERVFIDDVVVDGAVGCTGPGTASTGTITDTGGGSYSFDLTDDAGTQLSARVTCTWGSEPHTVSGSDSTLFRP
jgi:hypothetical protein